jgi:hypothetical protein
LLTTCGPHDVTFKHSCVVGYQGHNLDLDDSLKPWTWMDLTVQTLTVLLSVSVVALLIAGGGAGGEGPPLGGGGEGTSPPSFSTPPSFAPSGLSADMVRRLQKSQVMSMLLFGVGGLYVGN